MAENELLIKINATAKGFNDTLDEVKKKTEDFDSSLKQIATVSGAAFAVLSAGVGFAVRSFEQSEAASRQLTQALQNQGLFSTKLADSYKQQAAELQKLTGIDDDSIIKGQAILQGMIGRIQISKEMTAAAVELGNAMGGDVTQGFEILGRAMEGNTRGLKQFGIQIDENLPRQERTAKILEQVTQKLGGQAEAANKGVGGIKGLNSAIGDLQEEIGKRFAPAVEIAIKNIKELTEWATKSETFIKWTSSIVGAGIAVTGLITALAAVGSAFTAIASIATVLGVAMSTVALPVAAIAAGLGAAGIAAGKYIFNAGTAATTSKELAEKVDEARKKLAMLQERFDDPGKRMWYKVSSKDIEEAKKSLKGYEDQLLKVYAAESQKAASPEQDPMKLAEAKRAAAELEAQVAMERARNAGSAVDLDALGREKFEKAQHYEELLAQTEEFNRLSQEQQAQFRADNDAQNIEYQATEATAQRKIAQDTLQEQQRAQQQLIIEKRKFGVAYATINKAMHSEVYTGSKQAFGELAVLQTSSNATLKQIGKTAAVANIIIKTAESAMNIYAGFSTIPIIGPILGAAGAAAAVLFGAEQVGRVTAAKEGGVITGGIPGMDSVPALLAPGELVVPEANFEEVIGAVSARRQGDSGGEGSGIGGALTRLEISLKGDLMDFIEMKLVERQNLGLSLQRA